MERYLICVLFSMVAISGGHSWSPFTSPSEYQPYQNRKIPYLKSSFQMGQPQVGLPQFISANQIPNRFSQPKPIIQSQSATRIPSGTSPYQTRPFFQSQQPGRLPDPAPIPRPISQSTIVPQSSITYPTLSGRNNGYHWGYSWIDQFGSQMFREETSDGMGTVWGRYSFRDYNGIMRITEYIADANGFRTRIRSNEPGIVTSNPAGAKIIRFEDENNIPELYKKK